MHANILLQHNLVEDRTFDRVSVLETISHLLNELSQQIS